MPYRVTKTYGHERGLSACFRQPRATSHCRFLHGYALAFEIVFEAKTLDGNDWVIDFGSLGPVKEFLEQTFDHKTIISEIDPLVATFKELEVAGAIDLMLLHAVGCEAFAHIVCKFIRNWVNSQPELMCRHVQIVSVKCSEHAGNSATYLNYFYK